MNRSVLSFLAVAAWLAFAATVSPAHAQSISLELRPSVIRVTPSSHPFGQVLIGLYAVSDSESDIPFSSIDAVLVWDSGVIRLFGNMNNGPYPWLASWFPNDQQLDEINATFDDGTAYYQSLGRLAPNAPPTATPAGLLCTTLDFQSPGPGTSAVYFAPQFGTFTSTRVLDIIEPGRVLTGDLFGATVIVVKCEDPHNLDEDCDVDMDDVGPFSECLSGPADFPEGSACNDRDFSGDGHLDLFDYAEMMRYYTGSVDE